MTYVYRSIGRSNNRRRLAPRFQKPTDGREAIDPARFIKAAKQVAAAPYVPQHQFADFAVNTLIRQNLTAKGITIPSPIQDQAIPEGLAGRDVIGVANTGTGKTIAFAIPMLNKLLNDPSRRALIMAPTRELAAQIEAEFKSLAKGSGLYGALLIGGDPMPKQLKQLERDPAIVIGTPGRINDHLNRSTLDLSSFTLLCLDEVDRMLDMGFIDAIRMILKHMPAARQSFFFTATLDEAVSRLIWDFAHDPVTISVKTGETTDLVEQDVVRYSDRRDRMDKLCDLLRGADKTLIFDETQRSVERLARELQERGFKVDSLHGGKSQSQRQRAMKHFRQSDVTILIATDVAARGLDITDISHVINFQPPKTYDAYVHRIGRAGRAGRTGHAFTFVQA